MHKLGAEIGKLHLALHQYRHSAYLGELEIIMHDHLQTSARLAEIRCVVLATVTNTYSTFEAYATVYPNA